MERWSNGRVGDGPLHERLRLQSVVALHHEDREHAPCFGTIGNFGQQLPADLLHFTRAASAPVGVGQPERPGDERLLQRLVIRRLRFPPRKVMGLDMMPRG